jgi:glycosyltransferase involved in cell wall biosynthesis
MNDPDSFAGVPKTPLRVLILTHTRFPHEVRIEKEVGSLVAKGIQVTVIANRTVTKNQVSEFRGAEVLYVWMAHPLGIPILNPLGLMRILKGKKYDAIQVYDAPLMPSAMLLSIAFRIPLVYDAHDTWPLLTIYSSRSRLFGVASAPLHFICEAITIRHSRRVIAVSEGMVDVFARYYRCPPSKVVIVRNLPSMAEIADLESARGRSTELARPNSLRLVYFGTMDRLRTGELSRFIRAISILKNSSETEYTLKIIGGDVVHMLPPKALMDLAETLGVSDRVHFLGWVPMDEALGVVASADVGLIGVEKNLYADIALPQKLFQYMLVGVPILTSELEEVKRLVGSGVSYYQDNAPESLAKTLEGIRRDLPALRRRALELNQRALRNLTWENDEEKYVSVFESLRGVTPH